MTIKSRLIINNVLAAVILAILIGLGWYSMRHLGSLQDDAARKAHAAEVTALASKVGMSQYQAIADAMVNRDLAQSDKEWGRKKELNLKRMDELVASVSLPEEKQLASEAKKSFETLISLYETRLHPLLKANAGITGEMREIDDLMDKELEVIRVNTNKLTDSFAKSADKADKDFDGARGTSITVMLAVGIIGLLALVGFSAWISTSIIVPLKRFDRFVADLASGEGDLTRKIEYRGNDELGSLSRSLNQFTDTLHDIVSNVMKDGIQVVIGASRVHEMSDEITKESDALASQAMAVATASEEMSATSNDIASNCSQAAQAGSVANGTATDGSSVVQETVDGMQRIAQRVQDAAATVESLGARSDQIGTIVGTIQDIADQTNLLALNAAIEAARAGEQGRGFAVVADEVRALAERTTKATREISDMIRSIQAETRNAVDSMEQGVSEVEKGSIGAARSGQALQNIIEQINAVTLQISQIATAAEEQTATTSEISGNIQQVTDIAQKASGSAHEATSASNELLVRAEELMAILGTFKINEDVAMVLNKAKSAHLIFVGKIKAHLDGHTRVDGSALPTHLTCAFGKWYQDKGQALCGRLPAFREIEAPHAKVHELGKQAVAACDARDMARAQLYSQEMTENSRRLISIIERLEQECKE